MILQATYYDLTTGVVISSGTTCDPKGCCSPGSGFLEGVLGRPHYDYVVAGVVTPRPELPITVSGKTLSGVPAGAAIKIESETYIADGSQVTLSFDHPGTYLVNVSLLPYLDWSTSIEN